MMERESGKALDKNNRKHEKNERQRHAWSKLASSKNCCYLKAKKQSVKCGRLFSLRYLNKHLFVFKLYMNMFPTFPGSNPTSPSLSVLYHFPFKNTLLHMSAIIIPKKQLSFV